MAISRRWHGTMLFHFWLYQLAASSFVDPCAMPAEAPLTEDSDHAKFGKVLSAYVTPGTVGPIKATLVDYVALRENPADLLAYLRQLCDVSEQQLRGWNPANALALLINAYNALLLALVVHYNPALSVRDINVGGSIWKHRFLNLGGTKVSADEIEHNMIRGENGGYGYAKKVGSFAQGLIHAGVVCASLSCPDLLLEPFKGSTVVNQLIGATRAWLGNPTKNPGPSGGTLTVSKIFDWYARDFVFVNGSVQAYLGHYSPASWGSISSGMSLDYIKYDWNLNLINGTAASSCIRVKVGLALVCALIALLA